MEMAMAMTMTKKFEQGNVLGWREFRSWLGKEDCEDDNNLDNEVDDEEDHEGGHNDIIDNDDDTSGKIVTRDRPRKRAMWQVAILRESLQQLPLLISIAMVINGQWSSNLNIFYADSVEGGNIARIFATIAIFGNHCNDDDRNLQILNSQET